MKRALVMGLTLLSLLSLLSPTWALDRKTDRCYYYEPSRMEEAINHLAEIGVIESLDCKPERTTFLQVNAQKWNIIPDNIKEKILYIVDNYCLPKKAVGIMDFKTKEWIGSYAGSEMFPEYKQYLKWPHNPDYDTVLKELGLKKPKAWEKK